MSSTSNKKQYPIRIDETELEERLDELSFALLRRAATEVAFTGEYTDTEPVS